MKFIVFLQHKQHLENKSRKRKETCYSRITPHFLSFANEMDLLRQIKILKGVNFRLNQVG